MFSPWNSLNIKKSQLQNLSISNYYKILQKKIFQSIETLKSSTFICFLPIKIILKFLQLEFQSVFVKEFFISTKVGPKRIEHLQSKGIILSEATFRTANPAIICGLAVPVSWLPGFSLYVLSA